MDAENEQLDPKQQEDKIPVSQAITLYLHDIFVLLCTMMVALLLIFRVVVVSGTSMNMTLLNGDYLLLLSNTFYANPQQGDIVVISKDSFDNGSAFVKRIIATEGQTVDIDFEAGIVYVNGNPMDEPYTNTPTNLYEGVNFPLMVDDGCIFVMGDNRNESKDSRSTEIGQIDKREILGKAIFLFMPGRDSVTDKQYFSRIGALS